MGPSAGAEICLFIGRRGLRMPGHHCNNETGDRYPENCP
jgi:hypothetical protein